MRSPVLAGTTALLERDDVVAREPQLFSGEHSFARQAPERRTESLHGHERLLLAEDDPGVRSLTSLILDRLGYHVQAFASGPELLASFDWQTRPADLLLTDFEMPGLTGYELALQVRELQPSLAVLLTSGLPEETIVPAIRPMDWPCFISKPFTIRSLGSKLRELLDGRPSSSK